MKTMPGKFLQRFLLGTGLVLMLPIFAATDSLRGWLFFDDRDAVTIAGVLLIGWVAGLVWFLAA